MKLTRTDIAALAVLAALCARVAYPTQEQKQAGGLRLNLPVETPDGVHLSWTGGTTNAAYSVYCKNLSIPNGSWERIALGLTGVSGTYFHQGFSLDRNYSYRIQAEAQQ